MKNCEVKVLRPFNDATEKKDRNMGDIFKCTKERCDFLISKNAVELIGIEVDEKELKGNIENKDGLLTEEEIKNLKENEIIDVVVNKEFEEKSKKQNNKKKKK